MDLFSAPYDTNAAGVFWDVDECKIPDELDAPEVLQRMKQSLLDEGHRGPLSIWAYGDMTGLDFQSSEIKLNHFHSGEKRAKMTKILEDIVSWSGENPEPSVGMLVLGDHLEAADDADIAEVVKLLKSQKNYRFVVVSPGPQPPPPPPPTVVVMITTALPRGGL